MKLKWFSTPVTHVISKYPDLSTNYRFFTFDNLHILSFIILPMTIINFFLVKIHSKAEGTNTDAENDF